MIKFSKILQCAIISVLLLSASMNKASAVGIFPPVPGEPVFDGLTDGNKAVSVDQNLYNVEQTGFSRINTGLLNKLKGSPNFGNALGNKNSDKDTGLKTPGVGNFLGFNVGGISVSPNSTSEKDYFDMYYKLFFTYPDKEDAQDVRFEVLKTAYRHKTKEYKQDVIVNTYLTARYTEDYLNTIDTTLTRLNDCLSGKKEGNECIFFGMQIAKPSDPDSTEPQEGDNGQLGAVMNVYTVTTIYDRLLRIVEDLTATEAIFRAAQQIDVGKPISGDNESNAAEYIDNGLRFAYSDYHETSHATALISKYKRTTACQNGQGKNCPATNDTLVALKSVEDSSILNDLLAVEKKVNQTVAIHNLKSRLHEYKTQYRQYLMLKKLHDRALNVLKQSDKCNIAFLDKYLPNNIDGSTVWYGEASNIGDSNCNNYDIRQGLSGWLIDEYNKRSTQITIGESSECDGYYENCPSGYTKDETNTCTDSNSKTVYYSCIVETITQDTSNAENDVENISAVTDNWTDTDGFINGADSEVVQTEGRKQAELTWNVGRDGVIKFMKEGGAQFDLWSDQKVFQAEYLRQKYRNMRLIIESADQGKLSYEIGAAKAKSLDVADTIGIANLIKHITLCQTPDKAIESARQKNCSEYGSNSDMCTVEMVNGNIVTKKYVLNEGVKELMSGYPQIESQKVSTSDTCVYKNDTVSMESIENKINGSNICLTPNCLVQNFYPVVLGANATAFANNENRVVAADYLAKVIKTRQDEEASLTQWLKQKVANIEQLKQQVTSQKEALSTINRSIDSARKEKNEYDSEKRKSNNRLNAISNEIAELNTRMNKLSSSQEDIIALQQRIAKLNEESNCINGQGENCAAYIKNKPDDSDLYIQADATPVTDNLEIEIQTHQSHLYMRITDATQAMDKLEIKIQTYQSRIEAYKEDIARLEETIKTQTEDFAEEYIVRAQNMQKAIEASNDTFENFMEDKEGNPQSYRMLTKKYQECYKHKPLGLGCATQGPGRLTSDNVATTLQKVIYNNSNLKSTIKQGLNEKFFSVTNNANIKTLFKNVGVPGEFYVDDTFAAINITAGNLDLSTLISRVKDAMIEIASNEIENIIQTSDKAAQNEVEAAKSKIKTFTDQYNVSGSTSAAPSAVIYNSAQYDNLREKHLNLIESLRKPVDSETIAAGITDLSGIFGIPTESMLKEMLEIGQEDTDSKIEDTAYFVGLPARGSVYKSENGGLETDENAGRDFMPPRSPMAGLPPLREVFYFSAGDYQDVPQSENRPVLSHLLNCKYFDSDNNCEQEYLPEIWLHLLASPNLRNDGKYQHTFVERSFSQESINDLIQNQIANMAILGAKETDYRAIIGRAGVYPCQTASKTIIDIDGGDEVSKMEFMRRNSVANLETIPVCQEVTDQYGNACASTSGQLCHLLADHGQNANDTQKLTHISTNSMYKGYSELGQLLTKDLKYHPLQRNILEYLSATDDNNVKNDIQRQKAERASFKRNIMGSFLDAVITEDKANKAVTQNKNDMTSMVQDLCNQINELGLAVTNSSGETSVEDCTQTIMDKGLAISVEDNDYDVACDKLKEDDDYYQQIFCALDNAKDKTLSEIKQEKTKNLNKIEQKYNTIEDSPMSVKEKWDELVNNIEILDKDNDEYVMILPDLNVADLNIDNAKQDRNLVIQKVDEGLQSMDNQSQTAAYCPIY